MSDFDYEQFRQELICIYVRDGKEAAERWLKRKPPLQVMIYHLTTEIMDKLEKDGFFKCPT